MKFAGCIRGDPQWVCWLGLIGAVALVLVERRLAISVKVDII